MARWCLHQHQGCEWQVVHQLPQHKQRAGKGRVVWQAFLRGGAAFGHGCQAVEQVLHRVKRQHPVGPGRHACQRGDIVQRRIGRPRSLHLPWRQQTLQLAVRDVDLILYRSDRVLQLQRGRYGAPNKLPRRVCTAQGQA